MKASKDALNIAYAKLKKNVDAVGYNELQNGSRYKKAWEKAKEEYRELLKTYAYADYCHGVVGCLEKQAIEDASWIALLATLRSFEGKFESKKILTTMKEEYESFLEEQVRELEEMSDKLNYPIFVETMENN